MNWLGRSAIVACLTMAISAATVMPSAAQVAEPFTTTSFADASGGDGGSARGGDGGRGGAGVVPICNQNTDPLVTGGWADDEPSVNCAAGGRGGDGGEGGVSEGGEGGIAFTVSGGAPARPPETIRQLLADLAVSQNALVVGIVEPAESDGPTSAAQSRVEFIVTVVNNGPDPAVGAQLVNTLTATGPTVFDSVSGATCDGPEPGTEFSSLTIRCSLGDLAPGASVSVRIGVSPDSGETITNVATASSATTDPSPANSTSALGVQLGGEVG